MKRLVLPLLAFASLELACSSRPTPGAGGSGGQGTAGGGSAGLPSAGGGSTPGGGTAGGSAGAGGMGGAGTGGVTSTVSDCSLADPMLAASGREIKSDRGQGDVVVLRGTNLGGWLLLEPWMSPVGDIEDDYTVLQTLTTRFGADVTKELFDKYRSAWMQDVDFERLAEVGMNVIRIPFSAYHTQNEDGSMKPDAFEELDYAVSKAWEHCIYSIIDLHGAWGGASQWASSGKVGNAELFTNAEYQERSATLWKAVAEHYKGNPAVAGYDLVNEPNGVDGVTTQQERWDLQDKLYDAVRSVDPDHMVFIEAIWGLGELPPPADYSWTNVVYEVHHYIGFGEGEQWKQTDEASQKAGADSKVTEFNAYSHYDVPVFVGEFNFWQPAAAWNYGIELWDGAGLNWATWSYRAAVNGAPLTNSWGLYNLMDPQPEEPDIFNSSAEEIGARWAAHTADRFALNPMLKTALAMPAVAKDDYETTRAQALTVPAPGVLGNDTHLNSGEPGVVLSVAVMTPPAHGELALAADGSFTYTPESSFQGVDAFSYRVSDGRLTSPSPAVVQITVK